MAHSGHTFFIHSAILFDFRHNPSSMPGTYRHAAESIARFVDETKHSEFADVGTVIVDVGTGGIIHVRYKRMADKSMRRGE